MKPAEWRALLRDIAACNASIAAWRRWAASGACSACGWRG